MGSWEDVTTYEQLQAMTPAERGEHLRAAIVLEPARLPPAERERVSALSTRLTERARAREERLRGQAS